MTVEAGTGLGKSTLSGAKKVGGYRAVQDGTFYQLSITPEITGLQVIIIILHIYQIAKGMRKAR